jgi:hypothetical protein
MKYSSVTIVRQKCGKAAYRSTRSGRFTPMPTGCALPWLLSHRNGSSSTRHHSQHVYNVIPVPKHHTTEEHTGCGGNAPCILYLGISWSNMRIYGKIKNGMGICRGLFQGTFPAFAWRNSGKPRKLQSFKSCTTVQASYRQTHLSSCPKFGSDLSMTANTLNCKALTDRQISLRTKI